MTWRRRSVISSRRIVIALLTFSAPLAVSSTEELYPQEKLNSSLIEKRQRRTIRSSSGRRRLRGLQSQAGRDRKYVYDEIYDEPGIPIVQFPFSNQIHQMKQSYRQNAAPEGDAEHDSKVALVGEPTCLPVDLDFQNAADGRFLRGGTFVESEWSSVYGIKIKASNAEGKKSLHPMIFDSLNLESNGLETNDVFLLGSPNFECGGLGVGRGGRLGSPGENCVSLGNLIVPSRRVGNNKKQKDDTPSEESQGGILTFEFQKYTEVRKIGLLNAGDNSTIEVRHNDTLLETFEVDSVGANGYQKVQVGLSNVQSLAVSLTSLSGVAVLELCVQLHPPIAENGLEENGDSNR